MPVSTTDKQTTLSARTPIARFPKAALHPDEGDSQMVASLASRADRSAPVPGSSPEAPAAVTTTAWLPCVELTVAGWIRQGRWLGALGRGSGWWIGDWVRYGSARYGDRYRPAARVTGYDVQSLRNMAYVAGRFEVSRRRGSLSFSHHAELASLPVEEQDLWLDRAEVGGLSVGSLRTEMRGARQREAARSARAEVHQDRSNRGPEARSMAALKPRGVQPPKFAPCETDREAPENGSLTTHAEVVCPECGYHFFPEPAAPEISRPRRSPDVGAAPLRRLSPDAAS
jgi:hypothetical protein